MTDSNKAKPKSNKTSSLARNLMNQTLAQLAVDDQDEKIIKRIEEQLVWIFTG